MRPLFHPSAALVLALVSQSTQQTVETSWSSNTIGPDGPWQGVEVTVGSGQSITLFPGSTFYSYIIPTDYCDFNRSIGCPAASNGLYNSDRSVNSLTGGTGGIMYQPDVGSISRGLDVQGPKGTSWIDRMTVASGVDVANVSIAIVDKPGLAYPDGKWYPVTAGCLGLGGFGAVNQTFGFGDGSSLNASLIPGHLWETDRITSNAFGMHIGSAVAGAEVSGSLQWGGYDRSRVLGDIMASEVEGDSVLVARAKLTGIALEVVDGFSPFNVSGDNAEDDNLITSNGGVDVDFDGCSPYLTLPKTICDSIADNLPVTYDEGLGLYLWDTASRQYERIVSSASALAFTIESPNPTGSTGTKDRVTVRVPFAHLNLTLSAPLKSSPTPYFPCHTGGREGSDAYVLGRAFLQDAFYGANWNQRTWWLAQAPGPKLGNRNVREIEQYDTAISSADQAWADTWQGTWTALSEESAGEGQSAVPSSSPSGDAEGGDGGGGGLSTGAMAGIGVGAGVVALGLIAGLVLFFRRKKKANQASELQAAPVAEAPAPQGQWGGQGGYQQPSPHNAYGSPQHGYGTPPAPGTEYYKPQAAPAEMYSGGEHQPGYNRHEMP